tara:strand:- start:1295 stop:1966 length:672 start_codon:yes stop_codon:yes gene_type:complete
MSKKKSKIVEIDIVVPNDYSGITLRKYLNLQKDIEIHKEDDDAMNAALFYHLCGVEPSILSQLDTDTFTKIKSKLYEFLGNINFLLKRTITIDGVKYGFEPNLSKMAYGAYLDLTKFPTLGLDKHWAKVMSILYRPIVREWGALYSIEDYRGWKEWESEKWLDVSMDVHFGCFFFFNRLYKDLVLGILNSLKEKEEIPASIKSILERSGQDINQLHLLQGKTF